MKKIAIVVQLPKEVSPAQRFRIEQYEPILESNGFECETFPFLDAATHKILYRNGHLLKKITGVLKGFLRRVGFLFKAKRFDFIFLQREMAPVGPPLFEWIVARVLKVPIIYDFDDAIWIPNVSESNRLASAVKCFWKVGHICRWSHRVSVGNEFLANYARQFNANVVFSPTVVDTENRYPLIADHSKRPVAIGWTGSHSTIQFLAEGIPALQKLEKSESFRFLAICDRAPEFDLASLQFKAWNRDTEIEDLGEIQIGIMPLKEDAWSEGKCGFKLIQYMALGIPAIATPVGVNKKIIEDGVNGYLCNTEEEWLARLKELLADERKREIMGRRGREKIVAQYSLSSNASNFLSLFSK